MGHKKCIVPTQEGEHTKKGKKAQRKLTERGGRAQQIYTSSQKRLQVINELTSSTNFEAQMKTKKLHPSKT
uniref:Ovule protein n=1 Tax=Loa loa TaxID=7209 RepID=A0A1I7VVR3_LOALO